MTETALDKVDFLSGYKQFRVGMINTESGLKEAKEIVVLFPKLFNSEEQAKKLFRDLISTIKDIGAIREMPITGVVDSSDYYGYFRYFPGLPSEFEIVDEEDKKFIVET